MKPTQFTYLLTLFGCAKGQTVKIISYCMIVSRVQLIEKKVDGNLYATVTMATTLSLSECWLAVTYISDL